jgi:hypothetical protein
VVPITSPIFRIQEEEDEGRRKMEGMLRPESFPTIFVLGKK